MKVTLDPESANVPVNGATTPQTKVDWAGMQYQPNIPQQKSEYIPTPYAPIPNSLSTPKAEDAYQQAFPQRNGIAEAANQAVTAPQLTQPKSENELLHPQASTPYHYDGSSAAKPSWSADDYKDGTADGIGRNFLKTFSEPKTEDDYYKENESKKRILALGNALRHIGNIVYTSKGAPVQQFNDPVALQEQRYQTEKALREKKALQKQEAAWKQAQIDYQRDKAAADAAYRDFKIKLGIGNADRAERKLAFDNAYKNAMLDMQKDNYEGIGKARDANIDLQNKRFSEQQRHNKVSEGQGAERIDIAWYNATHKKGGSSSSGGTTGGKAIIATNDGYLTGKKDLNATEYQQAWDYLKQHGHITKQKLQEYNMAQSAAQKKAIIKEAVGWTAKNDGTKKGDAFRDFMQTHFGLGRTRGGKNQATVKVNPKKVAQINRNKERTHSGL